MNRILVRAPNWIGDQVLAYPFYRELRRAYPKAWIAVVCTEWVADIQFRGFVDEVQIIKRNRGESFLQRLRRLLELGKTLRNQGPWDFGITLPNSFGAALLLKLAKCKATRGYNTDWRGFLLTDRIPWSSAPDTHRSQAYLNLINPEQNAVDYWRQSGEMDFDAVRHWPKANTIPPPEGLYFVVAPGATADSRRWSTEQFAELISQVQKKYGWKAVVIGGPAEKKIAIQLTATGADIEDQTAKGTVSAHWKLFRQAKFAICNESGMAHVASLCGTGVQIVCGAADPKRTRPIGPGWVQVTMNPVDCWPCERNLCQFTDLRANQCLKGIHPDRVMEEIHVGFNQSE